MNIIILTQPLGNNYGGLLQAFALQRVLKKLGHSVLTEDRIKNFDKRPIWMKILSRIKSIIDPYYKTEKKVRIVSKYTDQFISKYIDRTEPVYSTTKEELQKYHANAYVVGSDQVWRPSFSRGIFNYFLDFVNDDNTKRISYSASFGTDIWEFNTEQEKKCKDLLLKFDAVSVREDSAVALCQEHFNVKPEVVLDPTLLLGLLIIVKSLMKVAIRPIIQVR